MKLHVYLIVFIVSFIFILLLLNINNASSSVSPSATVYHNNELVLIYLADSKCPYCESESVINRIREIDSQLRKIAKEKKCWI